MNNILIVDDEPIIVQGLFGVLDELETLELNVWKAYSAEEAIAVMERNRIDILITDIQMGEMSGLDLTRIVRSRWSRCRIIFLTGYADVEYLQFAVHQGAYDYLIKPVDDDKIVEVVRGVLAEIEAEWKNNDAFEKAKEQLRQARPVLQREFYLQLINGHIQDPESIAERLTTLDIPLRIEAELAVMVGRVDSWPDRLSGKDRTLIQYAITNIVEEYCKPLCRMSSFAEDRHIVWLLQKSEDAKEPDGTDANYWHWHIGEMLEKIQQSIRQVLDVSFSIVLSQPNVMWNGIHLAYNAIVELLQQGIGLDEEIIIIDRAELSVYRQEQQFRYNEVKNAVYQLKQRLENGEEQAFMNELSGLMHGAKKTVFVDYAFQLELFCTLSAMFLSYINTRKVLEQFPDTIPLEPLSNYRAHASWTALTDYYLDLARLLFRQASFGQIDEKAEIVRKIDDYIGAHLNGDLSLNHLAKQVHLSPFYLSRLYQKQKGYPLSQYIKEMKLEKAKQLLLDPEAKVQDVALQLGFDNVPYFAKFFKKQTGMTPQKYRREQ